MKVLKSKSMKSKTRKSKVKKVSEAKNLKGKPIADFYFSYYFRQLCKASLSQYAPDCLF